MRGKKPPMKAALRCLGAFMALAAGGGCLWLYRLTGSGKAAGAGLLMALALAAGTGLSLLLARRSLTAFSDGLCRTLDKMSNGQAPPLPAEEADSLYGKINHRLLRLYEAMEQAQRQTAAERADLQRLVSDVSHQVKTPVANLKIINATLLERPMPEEKRREFLRSAQSQLDKLEFLMEALVKTSRLETGAITLEKRAQPLYDTVAAALGGVVLAAESKGVSISVDCPAALSVAHDRRWTAEAVFNLLDNAVKYTPPGGSVRVRAECWEMYVKLDVADTGKGIAETRQGAVFRRFYREPEVHDTDGVGIGLYLTREIIARQGGYILLTSRPGEGSTFSVFLPRR